MLILEHKVMILAHSVTLDVDFSIPGDFRRA